MAKGSVPVLVGAGQTVSHWTAQTGVETAPGFLSLGIEAANYAMSDTGAKGLARAIDTIAMVRTMDDSIPSFAQPFGRCSNLPRGIAAGIGANPDQAIYEIAGGQSPQSLVNEMANRIFAGDCDVALICGSEAIGARKAARKAGLKLDFAFDFDGTLDDRGPGPAMLSRIEIKHGLVTPAFLYSLFENAYAYKAQRTRGMHRLAMSELFSRFSDVAANNPNAQFQQARSPEFLATPSRENYPFTDTYLKWHMAQDAVNMAAALVIMSCEKADALGIAQNARVYLHGAGEATDLNISERQKLHGSWAMEVALRRAFQQAEITPQDIKLFDLYSCFPIAVFSSTDIMGIDWRTDKRALTLTGGLPFFGGPGNNYSLHAIASMVEALRRQRGAYGLVLANGGWMTKEAAGVYSTEKPANFTPVSSPSSAKDPVRLDQAPARGHLETFTIVQGRSGSEHAIAFGRTENGGRFLATTRAPEMLDKLGSDTLQIGRDISVSCEGDVNTFKFA